MAPSDLLPPDVPLHRLLRRQEAVALLSEFEKLLPGGNLALIGADGHIYAGGADWDRAELQRLRAQAGEGRAIHAGDLVLQPVSVKSQLVGTLVARADGDPSPGPLVESVLRCLHVSLTLLLSQALEPRDVVSETLTSHRRVFTSFSVCRGKKSPARSITICGTSALSRTVPTT